MNTGSRRTILVVDDTPDNIDVLVGILQDEYNVKAATRGDRALRIVRGERPPDLILLDIMMPGMDGYAVCRELKKDPSTRHIPIIFVTAKIGVEDEVRGFELGASDYISKPVSPPVVKSRVRTHLALHDQNRELERKVRERTADLYRTRLQIIQRLGRAAEYKDNETGIHVIRVGLSAQALALAAGMGKEAAEMLLNAAPMHDVGKIGIPDRILLKEGRLDAEEWEIMKTHCQIGADIIGDEPGTPLLAMARTVALSHHERWDGSGYPAGLAGESIPLVGRIVAIVDVYDALISSRPYKEPWPSDRAAAYLREKAGHLFDPRLVTLFLDILPHVKELHRPYADDERAIEGAES
jgi:putative two-component system response regulator